MKHFKKFFSYLVALTMVLSLAAFTGVKVHAQDTTYTLTLTGTATGHTYEAYQVFTGDLSTDKDGKKVLSNVQWGAGVTYTQAQGENKSAADVANALSDGTMTIAQLQDKLTLTTPVKTVESSKGSTVIDGLAAGYYLVKDKNGTQANKSNAYTKFIVQVVGDTSAAIKSGVPTVTKKVKDTNDSTGESSGWQDSADYDIGDDVPYQITGTMPANIADYTTYKYVFTDTMSKGLTYTAGKATIKIGDTDVTKSFTENVTTNADGSTTVTWSCDNLKNKEDTENNKLKNITLTKDSTVVVTYSAKLNDKAVIGAAGNPNTVNLTYSNNPNKGGEGETGKTPNDKNIVFTYKTVVNKVDQDKNSLAGAGFKLQKKVNGAYTDVKSFTAGEATTFTFSGLDDGDYQLIESTTPAGYNTIAPIEFKIEATHDETADDPKLLTLTGNKADGTAFLTTNIEKGELTASVKNNKGSTLPSTGGMGTTLLYVAGGILVACAAAYVVMSRKHSTNK